MWRKRTAAAWCFAACVGYGSSAMWRQNSDALTHVHMHTYTLPRTLFSSINHGIFGSFRGGSEKPFQLQKDFFFSSLLSPAGSFVIIITGLILVSHFFTIAVLASSSHHLIFLRSFFFSEVMKKSHLSCGYCSKSRISTVGLDNWVIRWCNQIFPLVHTSVTSSLCCHSRGLNKCRWTV